MVAGSVGTVKCLIFLFCPAINECDSPGACHDNATCTDTFGNFSCACNSGFVGDGLNCSSELIVKLARMPVVRVGATRLGGPVPVLSKSRVSATRLGGPNVLCG